MYYGTDIPAQCTVLGHNVLGRSRAQCTRALTFQDLCQLQLAPGRFLPGGGNIEEVFVANLGSGYIPGELRACEPCAPCLADLFLPSKDQPPLTNASNASNTTRNASSASAPRGGGGANGTLANGADGDASEGGANKCDGVESLGTGFLGVFDTDARGGIRDVRIISQGPKP
jgi:hypothetical protein